MLKLQKVIKVGNSLAITLDGAFVSATGIKAGDNMAASYKPEHGIVSLAKSATHANELVMDKSEKAAYVTGQITPEFRDWVEQSLEEDKEAMDALRDL